VTRRVNRRVAVEVAWVVGWAASAAWLGTPRTWWWYVGAPLTAGSLALFCVHRLRTTTAPDDWSFYLYAGPVALIVACGAVGQLVTGRPWFATWSLGPHSILLGAAIFGVVFRDWRLRQAERSAMLQVRYPWSDPPERDGRPT
jgi:uncharacterized membrane protein